MLCGGRNKADSNHQTISNQPRKYYVTKRRKKEEEHEENEPKCQRLFI